MTIYVAGPVLREPPFASDIYHIYQKIEVALSGPNVFVSLPYAEERLERSSPRDFFDIVGERIAKADKFVGVLSKGDQSVPVETAIAGLLRKPIILVSTDSQGLVPRILAGMPSIVGVGAVSEIPDLAVALLKARGTDGPLWFRG